MESATDELSDLNLNAGEDEEEEDEEAEVLLAFVRDPEEPDELQRHRFPDKAGGAPAWLDPVNLPAGEAWLCGFCGEPLRFVLQVYAPLPPPQGVGEDEDEAYHRALFVFMCPAMACLLQDQREQRAAVAGEGGGHRRSVKVFRCQLPRESAFYSYDETAEEARCTGVEAAPLCAWCGTWRAERACPRSATTASFFCSETHLERHLMRSGHCNGGDDDAASASAGSDGQADAAWPEYVMYSEKEPLARDDENPSMAAQEQDDDDENPSMAAQEQDDDENPSMAAQEQDDDGHDGDDDQAIIDAWMDAFEADKDNTRWASFLARVSPKQKQVLRYCGDGAGARPLWPVATGSLAAGAAPPCPRCGAPSWYELQLMPQLLDPMRVEKRDPDPLDWATVVVYTCAQSCGGGGGYVEEFAWVQLQPPKAGTSTTAMGQHPRD